MPQRIITAQPMKNVSVCDYGGSVVAGLVPATSHKYLQIELVADSQRKHFVPTSIVGQY